MSELNDERDLDPELLRKMELKIFNYEHENHKTKKLTDSEMVQKIRRTIEEMVRQEEEQ